MCVLQHPDRSKSPIATTTANPMSFLFSFSFPRPLQLHPHSFLYIFLFLFLPPSRARPFFFHRTPSRFIGPIRLKYLQQQTSSKTIVSPVLRKVNDSPFSPYWLIGLTPHLSTVSLFSPGLMLEVWKVRPNVKEEKKGWTRKYIQ